ncbi:MAG: methylmalonyl Co-A mutase-associated GTPase MeaB [bacterium]|nr:methylmalonyl Co-A mutase-associated GTPase MeaB [bacterium]
MDSPTPLLPIKDEALAEAFRHGSRRALARIITRLDNGEDPSPWLQALEKPEVAGAPNAALAPRVIGITGPPGAGKSSLIGCLIPVIRRRGLTVAVLAVDPESPYTGGAILGDRIRMGRHATGDPGVYIRSLSTRGSAGGLSRSTRSICRLVAAFGFDLILLETVGAGQAELSVMDAADVVLLVLVPGTGDSIQWEKAGQVEIADVFALNKADLPGIDALESALRSALDHGFVSPCPPEAGHEAPAAPTLAASPAGRHSLWDGLPPIVRTVGNEGEGVDELLDHLQAGLKRVAERPGLWRSPVRRRLRAGLEEEFERRMRLMSAEHGPIEELTEKVRTGELTLEEAIQAGWRQLDM